MPPLLGRDQGEILQSADFLWITGALVATLLIGAFILSRVERWRKRQLSDSAVADVEQLGSFRAMYENGELSKEEYDRIKAKEAKRLRDRVSPRVAGSKSAQNELPANPSLPDSDSNSPLV